MKLYQVDISPAGKEELWNYVEGAREFGDETVLELLTCFDSRVDFLEENP